MAKVGRIDPFGEALEPWASYNERLESFFKINKIEGGDKIPALLSLVGPKTYQLLRSLCAPDKPAAKQYADIVGLLNVHFAPKRLVIAERFRFYKREQREGESIKDYVAELRKLSEYCEFGNFLKDSLRDRLVCGLRNKNIQEELLTRDELTFDMAVQVSVGMEAASRDAIEFQAKHQSFNETPVHKMNFKSKYGGAQGKPCYRCLGTNHKPSECKFQNAKCHKCGKMGHIIKACHADVKGKMYKKREKKERKIHSVEWDQGDSDDSLIANLELNHVKEGKRDIIWISPKINGKSIEMELDTGSAVSVISKGDFDKYFKGSELQETSINLHTYSGEKIMPLGVLKVDVEHREKHHTLDLYVVPKGGPALLGREWLHEIQLDWQSLKAISVMAEKTAVPGSKLKQILSKYDKVFKPGIGKVKNIKANLTLKEDSQPKFYKARPVPFSLRPKVNKELDRLEAEGILSKVKHSQWATPIVPIPKKDDTVRLCGDFKTTVNPALKVDQYPLPRIDDIFASLAGGQKFSKIDLRQAYLQLEVAEENKEYLTINTHRGLYRFNRLAYGIAAAPAIWQRTMDQILQGIEGVKCILDDMIITGKSADEHLENLENVLHRLGEYNLQANLGKCEFFKDSIQFCGHVIDQSGLHKTNEKIESIVNAPVPENVSQLRSLLGLVNYYAKFLPNLSTVLSPMYELLNHNKKWNWSPDCNKAFKKVKSLIASDTVLTHYDPKLPLKLACDASPYGLGAVLSHITHDGLEQPIAFASRTLSSAEKNYSQIDKEALGIIFGVKKSHTYLYGREFTLETDHQPLVSIFHPHKGIPETTAARLQRYAIFLAGYQYTIVYKNTKKHGNADGLSRLPLEVQHSDKEDSVDIFHLSQLNLLPVTNRLVQQETKRDPVLSRVYETILKGWTCSAEERNLVPFYSRRNELTVFQGCVMWGIRVVIPSKLRQQILCEIHEGHLGIVKMKALARGYVWWPGIDKDLEKLAKTCTGCQTFQNMPKSAPLHPWEWPSRPWQRVHIDFAGPFMGSMFFIMVDAHSKWPEVIQMNSTTSAKTIDVLRIVFARNGLPEQVVSDNGPQFISEEFGNFMQQNSIKHITSAPYHPSTNGLAERFVQSFKQAMKSAKREDGSLNKKLANFLLAYRNAPHCTTNETPAQLFLQRNLVTRLDRVKPNLQQHVINKQFDMIQNRHAFDRRFEIGQDVSVRDYRKENKWTSGTICKQTGPVSYQVEVAPNSVWRRHTDQIRDTPKPSVVSSNQIPIENPFTTPKNVKPSEKSTTLDGERRYPKRERRPPKKFDL